MIHSAKKQKGFTFLTMMLILGLIAFFVLLTLKIAPIYMNHSKVLDALTAVEGLPNVENISRYEIKESLRKRFSLNYVDYVEKEDIKINSQVNYVKVEIEYERVVPIVGNLSVLVEFYDHFEVGGE